MGLKTIFQAWMVIFIVSNPFAIQIDDLKHLMSRVGFGMSQSDVELYKNLDRSAVIHRVLISSKEGSVTKMPDLGRGKNQFQRSLKDLSQDARSLVRSERREMGKTLKAWWIKEMVHTNSPITEKMTLFWHGHFTSSLRKVKLPVLMAKQNALFRKNSMGSFSDLLKDMVHDPALAIYLDNHLNRKKKPNENLARELLELFTLGEGNYTESDVKAAARALTGSKYSPVSGKLDLVFRRHDSGKKQFLGRVGNFSADDIVQILLKHPQTAIHIATKIWNEFISIPPSTERIAEVSDVFRGSDYSIKKLLSLILNSSEFWSPKNRLSAIKSPVELLVGVIRGFEITSVDFALLVKLCRQLGQDLFDPPNVKGWSGGQDWITTYTLSVRQRAMHKLVEKYSGKDRIYSILAPEWQLK